APVGWFPLAPHEVFVPSYRSSQLYVRNVNSAHVTNINHINVTTTGHIDYANRHHERALTVVPAHVMASAQRVAPAALPARALPEQSGSHVAPVTREPGARTALVARPEHDPVRHEERHHRAPPS